METVCMGDLLSLYIEGSGNPSMPDGGYLGMGKLSSDKFDAFGGVYPVIHPLQPGKGLPNDFFNLCIFEVELGSEYSKKGENCLYGEAVRLKHLTSGKFLSISNVSSSESSDRFVCQLVPNRTSATSMLIIPRYKMRSEGEQVYYNDKVTVMNKGGGGQYIGYVRNKSQKLGQSSKRKDHMVVSYQSVTEGWQLKVYKKFSEETEGMLDPGSFIRLFHKEVEGFLIARPDDYDIRERKSPLPQLLQNMISNPDQKILGIKGTNSFQERKEINSIHNIWQFEHEKPEDGDSLEWNQPVRIRHVLYGKYLKIRLTDAYLKQEKLRYKEDGTLGKIKNAVDQPDTEYKLNEANSFDISLVDDYEDPDTLFELKPVIAAADDDYIPSNSTLRIMHKITQSYLKAEEDRLGDVVRRDTATSFDYWFSELNTGDQSLVDQEAADDASSAGHSESDRLSQGSRTSAGMTSIGGDGGRRRPIRKLLMTTEGVDQHVFMATAVKNITYDYMRYGQNLVNKVLSFIKDMQADKEKTTPIDQKEQKKQLKALRQIISNLKVFVTGQVLLSSHDLKTGAQLPVWKNKAMKQKSDKKKDKIADFDNKEPIRRRQKLMRDLNIFEVVFGVIQHFWEIHYPRWVKEPSDVLDKIEKAQWSLCKYCHTFIRKLISGNQNVIDSLLDLGAVDVMLEQISTGWNPAISDIFLATSGRSDQTLLKKDIKSLVDQVEEACNSGDYRYEIVDFLSSICAPAGKGNYMIQKWSMELMIGTEVSSDRTPSRLIFHTSIDSDADEIEALYLLTDNRGFIRPDYIASKREKEEQSWIFSDKQINIQADKELDRSELWMNLETFLPNNFGYYQDIDCQSLLTSHISLGPPDGEEAYKLVQRRDKEVSYFRSLMKFYKSLCASQNLKCQKIVSALIPVDQILLALKMEINDKDKTLFLDLLNILYINSAAIGPLPKTILPTMLIWKGDQQSNWDDDETQENSRKIFVIASQPDVINSDSDWVNSWEASGEDEGEGPLPALEVGISKGTEEDETESVNLLIFQQRLGLYNYAVKEMTQILTDVVENSFSLSMSIFKILNPDSYDYYYWSNKFDYWESYLQLMRNLIHRSFFDPDYNSDIEAIQDFKEQKESIAGLEVFKEWMADKAQEAKKELAIIPISAESEDNDVHYLFNIITNILIQTGPQRHYKLIPPQNRNIEMYNIILSQLDVVSVANKLADFKTQLLSIAQGIYDVKQTDRVYRLWDMRFKPLYKNHFRALDYNKQFDVDSSRVSAYVTKDTKSMSFGASFFKETEVTHKLNSLSAHKTVEEAANAAESAGEILTQFKEHCKNDLQLQALVNEMYSQSPQEFDALSNVLLDLILYNKPLLVLEATNMLHRHFSQRYELKIIYSEATLLLENKDYKVVKLLNSHRLRLIDLTQNFTKIPTKQAEMIEFYRLFKAGNPLRDENIKECPGLVDLCYCGIDTANEEYTVFRRNQLLYDQIKKKSKKKKQQFKMLKRQRKKNKAKIKQNKQKRKAAANNVPKVSKMEDTLRKLKALAVSPEVGKFDLWATNQELMRSVGIHHNLFKLLSRVFGSRSKNRPANDPAERQCQLLIIKVLYEFLYYFIWQNDANAIDVTQDSYLDMLVQQIELDKTVVRLLTEIIVDNDGANELINENTVTNIINKLNPESWDKATYYERKASTYERKESTLLELEDAKHMSAMEEEGFIKPDVTTVFRDIKNPAFPARFIDLLKTLVESDNGPKPARQKQVIDNFFKLFKDESPDLNRLLLRDEQNDYQFNQVIKMYEGFVQEVNDDPKNVSKTPFPDSDDEKEFNFHLQLMDLLGMCAKGRNITTTNYCRQLYENIDSLTRPLAEPELALCIRTPITRFIHGVYFSDPKYRPYLDEESQNLWDFFDYSHFKRTFMNIIKDLQKLIQLFKDKDEIENGDQLREAREDAKEDEDLEEKKRMKQQKKDAMKLNKGPGGPSFLMNWVTNTQSQFDDSDEENKSKDDLELDDVAEEAKELNIYLLAESYEDYVFDVLLPFLTDILRCDIEFNCDKDLHEIKSLDEFNWKEYKSLETPEFIQTITDDEQFSLANLFRVIVFHVLQINTDAEVAQKENWREGVSDFLIETLNYLTDHFNDKSTILDHDAEAAQSMQVIIITNIHKIKSDALQNLSIQGDMDMNQELIREIKKKKMIMEKALPCFVKAALKASQKDNNKLLTFSLRRQMNDEDILPEFSSYVKLMEKKLGLFIRWSDNDLTQLQNNKKKKVSKKQKRSEKKLQEDMDDKDGTQQDDDEDENEEDLDEDDLDKEDQNDEDEDEEEHDSDSEDEDAGESGGILGGLFGLQKKRTVEELVKVKHHDTDFDEFDAIDYRESKNRRSPQKQADVTRIGGIKDKQKDDADVSHSFNKGRESFARHSGGSGGLGRSSGNLGRSSFARSSTNILAMTQGLLAGEQQETTALTKIDEKHFTRWTGYGGKYLAKLIEILTDLSNEGTEQGDAFHIRMMQALLVNHEIDGVPIEKLQRYSLHRKQEAMSELGVCNMVMMLIALSRSPKTINQYVKTILTEAVQLGTNLLALGNEKIQKTFLEQYEKAIDQMLPSQYFLIAIRELIREARNNITTPGSEDEFLRHLIKKLLIFVKNFCEGHFTQSQIFLQKQSTSHNVDLITEISSFLYAICEKIKRGIVYVDSPDFIEKQCPTLITDQYKKKRLIAWYKQTCEIPDVDDINLAAQVYRTLSECIQGPCEENQLTLVKARACRSVQDLLEYIGSFFYRKTWPNNQLKWSGHGIGVYYNYQNKTPVAGDIDATQIARFCKLMEGIDPENDPTGQHILIRHDGPEYVALIEAMDRLEQNILVFMNSLLEGNQSSTDKGNPDNIIAKYIQKAIDEDIMIHSLHNYHKTSDLAKNATLEMEMKGDGHGQWISRQRKKVFLYYSFLILLTDKDEQGTLVLKKKLDTWTTIYRIDMTKIVGRIEIQNHRQNLEVIYFPLPPVIITYWPQPAIKEYKNVLIDTIIRDNPEEKVTSFQEKSDELLWFMKHLKWISLLPKSKPGIGHVYKFLSYKEAQWELAVYLLTLLINVFMIFVLETDGDDVISDPSWGGTALSVFGFLHLGFMTVLFIAFILKKGIFYVKLRLRRKKKFSIKVRKFTAQCIDAFKYLFTCCSGCMWCRKKQKSKTEKTHLKKVRRSKKVEIPISKWVWSIYYLFSSAGFNYMTLCLIFSILGATHSPAWFSFHAVMLVVRNKMIQQVFNSVYYNGMQLVASLILAIIFLFWYSLIAFVFDRFRNEYTFEGDKMQCESLLACFRVHFDYGLTVNPFWIEEPVPVEGIPINLSYFIIINLIITSVISAIIIDTFSQLRSELLLRQADTQDRCFICNIDRDDFDKLGLVFNKHIKKDHYMWNYLFFRAYLEEVDTTEMTGQETFVYNEMNLNSIKFYPIKKALGIEGRNKEKKDLPTLFMKVDALQKRLEEGEEDRDELSESLNRILTKVESIASSKS